ncbi:YiiD C-terminal domain-containing protein [Amphritea sp. HPY]|uniref:YiiD C-terminal domain-containing protein n=1 Tax=Amphritea sp. HPY TaxID=3421652 RepID=UPI003D7D8858
MNCHVTPWVKSRRKSCEIFTVRSIRNKKSDAASLEAVLHREIPLTKVLGLCVASLASRRIRLEAPVSNVNANIHGTAFSGSIYSISALAAWGLTYHLLQAEGVAAELVVAEGSIKFWRPVKDKIIAETCFSCEEFDVFMEALEKDGKAVLLTDVQVSDNNANRASNKIKLVAMKL